MKRHSTSPLAARPAAGYLLLVLVVCAAALLFPGCSLSGEAEGEAGGEAGSGEAEGEDEAGTVVHHPLPGNRPIWMLPEDGVTWRGADVMAVLALPESLDPSSVRIALNGADVTERFRPVGFFPEKWAAGQVLEAARSGGIARIETARRMLALLRVEDLNAGENRLVATWPAEGGATDSAARTFETAPPAAPHRTLRLRVARVTPAGRDERAGARVLVEPLDGAPPVDLSPYPPGHRPDGAGERGRGFLIVRDGTAEIVLPEGRYHLTATGGPLDSVAEWTTPVRGDGEHAFTIRREVALPGTVTADFHVHASPSADSRVPLDERVRAFLAGGVDVLVASDHDHVTDYRPVLDREGIAPGKIRVISGVEATVQPAGRRSLGHWNVWPLDPDPAAPPALPGQVSGGGALPAPGPIPGTAADAARLVAGRFDEWRALARDLARRSGRTGPEVDPPVIQLNHPRGLQIRPGGRVKPAHDYLNEIGFDPGVPLGSDGPNAALSVESAAGTTSLDFDAIEVWNRSSPELYRKVRRDWFSLLNQGLVRTGVANTDTHNVSVRLAGYPMNVVFLPAGESGGPRTPVAALAAAVRGGHVVGTDGPVPLLSVSAAGRRAFPGHLLRADGGRVQVRVDVLAAAWIPPGPVRVWVNGRIAHSAAVPADPAGHPPPLAASIVVDIPLTGDAWILAEAGDTDRADADGPLPGLYGRIAPNGLAVGFTNPVLVDADGNGRFDAPGLSGAHGAPGPTAGALDPSARTR